MIRTRAVTVVTTLLVVRYRLELITPGTQRTVTQIAEDAQFVAFTAAGGTVTWLDNTVAEGLLTAGTSGNVADEIARTQLQRAIDRVPQLLPHLIALGEQIAEQAVTEHRKIRTGSGARVRGLSARLLPPPDVLGVFLYLPGGQQ